MRPLTPKLGWGFVCALLHLTVALRSARMPDSSEPNLKEAAALEQPQGRGEQDPHRLTAIGAASKDEKIAEKTLEALPKQTQRSLIKVWGRPRTIALLEKWGNESKKDMATVGYSSLNADFLRYQINALGSVAWLAEQRQNKRCSALPDALTSHIWRYNRSSLASCLGIRLLPELSQQQAATCRRDEPITNSDSWTWKLSTCKSYGGMDCALKSGEAGCCCPMGKLWDQRQKRCVNCATFDALREGERCMLTCTLLPGVSTTLTCGSGSELQGEPPEGECRWQAEDEPVQTEGGEVEGLVRPILWRWDSLAGDGDGARNLLQDDGGLHLEVVDVRTYWQIPYGRPVERFRRPRQAEAWAPAVRKAIDWWADGYSVPHCGPGGVDDCLHLAVYAPKDASPENPRPVMFWIEGDGFMGDDKWLNGRYDMARYVARQDVIIVIPHTRSALLGHWASLALKDEDERGSTGNYEMLDQRLALEWVNKNIAMFGGDASRITIGGHSSGGFSVAFHLFSPASRGLFHSAINEGTTFDNGWYFAKLDDAVEFYAELGEALGCPRKDAKTQIDCVRGLPASAFSSIISEQVRRITDEIKQHPVVSAYNAISGALWSWLGFGGSTPWPYKPQASDMLLKAIPLWPRLPVGIVVDGSEDGLLVSNDISMQQVDKMANVPVMVDYGHDEGTLFAALLIGLSTRTAYPSLSHRAAEGVMRWAFGGDEETSRGMMEFYPRSGASPFGRLSNVISDAVFRCSNRRLARARAELGVEARPVYLAQTDFVPRATGLDRLEDDILGANHMMAISYLTASATIGGWSEADEEQAMAVNCHYAFFLFCGSPTVSDKRACYRERIEGRATPRACEYGGLDMLNLTVPFEPFNASAPSKYIFQSRPRVEPYSVDEQKRCDWWDAHPASHLRFVPTWCRNCSHPSGDAAAAMRGSFSASAAAGVAAATAGGEEASPRATSD